MTEDRQDIEREIEQNELFNIEAEQAVLGTMLMNNEYVNRVSEFLLPVHFYEPAHQRIYEQIIYTIDTKNIVANSVTLKQFFDNDDVISKIGGSKYLATLLSQATGIIDIADYAKEIIDLAIRRNLVVIGGDIVNTAHKTHGKVSAQEQIEGAETSLYNLAHQGNYGSDYQKIASPLKETIDNMVLASQRDSNLSGTPTKLRSLDKLLGGLHSSDLLILAARPSMGKSALAINIAINASKFFDEDYKVRKEAGEDVKRKAVGFFSLEMSSQQVAARMLSKESSINSLVFRTGRVREDDTNTGKSTYRKINDAEYEAIANRSDEISKLPFLVDDTPALSISAVRNRVRRMVRKHNLAFLVVDYLQLLHGTSLKAQGNRVLEISEITQGLKAIAKEFNIPVLALSQLSRAVESRDDKKPQLSDLRESGTIEQDADVVMFIYREVYYKARMKPSEEDFDKYQKWAEDVERLKNKSEVIIAKQRNGPIGDVELYFEAEFGRFSDPADAAYEEMYRG